MDDIMNELEIKRMTYPRVSEIIGIQNESEMRAIPLDVLANACIRGDKIHAYCSSYLKGLWIEDIETEYLPYFEAFVKWYNENGGYTVLVNNRLYDDVNRFTGEFDFIVKLKNSDERVLVDIKTSNSPSKSWPIQLSAYHLLCEINGIKIDKMMNLHLKKVKNAKTKEYVIVAQEIYYPLSSKFTRIFISALECYDYFNRKEDKNVTV